MITLGEMLLEVREDVAVDAVASVYAIGQRLGVNICRHLGPAFDGSERGMRARRVLAIERAAVLELRREGKLRVTCGVCTGLGCGDCESRGWKF